MNGEKAWLQFMPEFTPKLNVLIEKIEPLRGAVVLEKLAGGPASDSWLLSAGDEKFVVRLDKPLTRQLGLDRYAELEILDTVSEAGIGPQIVWSDPKSGVLISSYIPGCTWSVADVHDLVSLENLAVTLRRLHSLPPRGPAFEPGKRAWAYARMAGTETADNIAVQAARQAEALYSDIKQTAICHNDLVHSNIIGKGAVRLIDWEYAAVGDPVFDLAIVVRHHQLQTEQIQSFLTAYYDSPGKEQFSRLEDFCRLYDLLAALWYLSVISQTGQDANYEEELERILARL